MTESTAAIAAGKARPAAGGPFVYDNTLVVLSAFIVALVSYDRLAVGFIAPYLVTALNLTNFQVGSLVSILGLSVAICGFFAGRLADAKGWGKQIVIASLVGFAICCVLTSLAPSYTFLLVTRFLTGMAIGPATTVSQGVFTGQSTPSRLGVNVGAETLIIYLLSQMAGPVILIALASSFGWQAAFLASSLPALAFAVWYVFAIKPTARPVVVATAAGEAPAIGPAPNNVWICLVVFVLFMAWMIVHGTFLSQYLVNERRFTNAELSLVLSVLGAAAAIGGLGLPVLSNTVGRKPVAILGCIGAAAFPFVVQFFHGPLPVYAALLFITWLLPVGATSMFVLLIPGESAAPSKTASNIAMILGSGEIFGVFSPIIGGRLADSFGLPSVFWFTGGLGVAAILMALLLKETRQRAPAAQ
jgi:predicted MFS family arabinose efflux permease